MVRHTFWKSNFGKMILQVFKTIWERWPKFNHVSKCTDPSDVRTVSFCMWNFAWKNKAQLALFPQTNFHIQKCNTCRSIEKPSRGICYLTMVQHSCRSGRKASPEFSETDCQVSAKRQPVRAGECTTHPVSTPHFEKYNHVL